MDYIELGSSPYSEDCAQLGQNGYYDFMRVEMKEFKRMMEELHPNTSDFIGYYKVKSFPHDFGTYHELCVVYDDNDDDSINWALETENSVPEYWDNTAKQNIQSYKDGIK